MNEHKADKQYGVEYNYAGSTWVVHVWADNIDDAQRKLRALGANGRVMGEIKAVIKVPGWIERAVRWLTQEAGRDK